MHRNRAPDNPLPDSELRQVVDAFSNEVVNQYHEFGEFKFLYYTSESQIELLNAVASQFFAELFYILLDRIVLNVSKLTDPAKTFGHENLSVRMIHERCSVRTDYPRADAENLVIRLEKVTRSVKDWRNKIAAHLDLSTAMHLADVTDKMKPSDTEEFYGVLQEYLDLVYPSLFDDIFPIATVPEFGAEYLVRALKK